MKGKQGVSMQGIEYAPKKKGNVKCAECKHLEYKPTKNISPYWCEIKQQARFYTAQCYCRQYEGATNNGNMETNKGL